MRLLIAIAAPLALAACAVPVETDAGESTGASSAAILNGTAVTTAADFGPVMVRNETSGEACSGELVTDRWVLTAAHCFDGTDPATVSVRVDGIARSTHGEYVELNPGYDRTPGLSKAAARARADVAMIRLQEAIPWSRPFATYYPFDPSTLAGLTVDCYGYGNSGINSKGEEFGYGTLRKATFTVSSTSGIDKLILLPNLVPPQRTAHGDSGSSCFFQMGVDSTIAGVVYWSEDTDLTTWLQAGPGLATWTASVMAAHPPAPPPAPFAGIDWSNFTFGGWIPQPAGRLNGLF